MTEERSASEKEDLHDATGTFIKKLPFPEQQIFHF